MGSPLSITGPTRALLFAALAGASLWGAKETWVEVKSPHFVAYSDAGEAEARKLLQQFEEIRTVFLKVFPKIRVDAPKPTILLVTRDEASMKRFSPKSFEGKDAKRESGLFSSGPERNYALIRLDAASQFDKPFHVLFHEYTHGVIHLNFPGIPTWLDEGIADFYGTTEIQKDRVLIGRISRDTLRTLQETGFLPMDTLLAVNQDSHHYRDGSRASGFYAQSALLVHYLFMDPQAQKSGLFGKYLAAISHQADPLTAGREALGDLGHLLTALLGYSRQPTHLYWTYGLSAQLSSQDFSARTLEPAQALVVRAEYLQQSQQEPASRPLLQEALKLGPALPEVHAAQAFGLLEQGQDGEARKELEEALRLGSLDFRVYYHLAYLNHGATREPDARQMDLLERARQLRPDFPPVHQMLGQAYARDPAKADQALREMRLTVELDPSQLAYLANFGAVCMTLDREAEAKAVLDRLRGLARTESERRMTEQYDLQLQQYQEWHRAAAARQAQLAHPPPAEPPAVSVPARSISFHLPSHLVALGQEALRLAQEGKVGEAIQKVEAARAKAKQPFDRKSLQDLLDQLRGLQSDLGR